MVGSHECQDVNVLLFLLQLDTVIYLTREQSPTFRSLLPIRLVSWSYLVG